MSATAELLVALIRNRCVNDGSVDSGHEHRSVDTLADFFGERGQEYEPHPGRRSVLYRIPGSDDDAPSLTLMGHLDVVPVTPEGWRHDPFAGERHDGEIWGRGSVDMLNLTAAMAVVFERHLHGDAPRLPGDLMFLGVADEEAGGRLGAQWLVAEHWDDVACDYLLTEIGTPLLDGVRGAGIPVTVAEKGPQWRRVTSHGIPGHGSQPYGTANALLPLARAVAALGDTPTAATITDEWRRFVAAWAPDPELADALVDPERVDEAVERLASDDPGLARWVHACTHLTVSPNVVHGGTKANVIADHAVAEVDVRSLPGQTAHDVEDHFRKVIGPDLGDIDVEVMEATAASGSPPSGLLWDAIEAAASDVAPDTHLVPSLIPVGTDARFFRRRGTIAYGVGLFDRRVAFGDFLQMFHGHDERIGKESLDLTTALLERVVARFGSST